MPSALSLPIRHEIIRRRLDGQEFSRIALELGLSYHSVRQIWRTFRQRGDHGLEPRYHLCGRHTVPDSVLARACDLKTRHPRWGAQVIRVELARELAITVDDLPAVRTLQLAFRAAGLQPPRRPQKERTPPSPRATRAHEVWEVDAVEKARMRDGRLASWLTVVDEATGTLLDLELSPPGAVARGHTRRGPRVVAPRLHPLGSARTHADRQRPSLGHGQRPASGTGPVAGRVGRGARLEPRPTTLAQSPRSSAPTA